MTLYLMLYLFFIIAASLFIGWLVWKTGSPSPRLLALLFTAFIVVPAILVYCYFSYFDLLPEVAVPDVRGIDFNSAQERLAAQKLAARVAGNVFEAKFPEGVVASQRPEAGRKVKIGRVVNLMISSGKRKVVTPNLLGRPVSQAEAVLSAAELQVGEQRTEQNYEAPDGTILAQEPLPGEQAEVGRAVDLLIASSREVDNETITREGERQGFKLW